MREEVQASPSWGACRVVALMRERHEVVVRLAPRAQPARCLQEAVAHACSIMAVSHVARWRGLHWSAVRALERQRLLAEVQVLPPPRPHRLNKDELVLFKGHSDATAFLDAGTGRVRWVGEGRSCQSIGPFFLSLGKRGRAFRPWPWT